MAVFLFIFAILLAASVGGFAIFAAKVGDQTHLNSRLKKIAGKEVDDKHHKNEDPSQAIRKRQIQNKLKEMEEQKKKKEATEGLSTVLLQAGLEISVTVFWLLSFLCGAGLGAFLFITKGPIMGVLGGVFGLFILPKYIVKRKRKKRLKNFTEHFADALDIIVRGIKSGLPVGECMKMIGREMPDPVGQEFRLITEGQKLGLPTEQIMDRSIKRIPTDDLRFFAVVLLIQQQTGGNLADTLSKLSDVLRQRKRMKDKVQALSSEAKASAMIIGSLPFALYGILSLVAPDYVGILLTSTMGLWMVGGGIAWMTIGILVMKKMINFEM